MIMMIMIIITTTIITIGIVVVIMKTDRVIHEKNMYRKSENRNNKFNWIVSINIKVL